MIVPIEMNILRFMWQFNNLQWNGKPKDVGLQKVQFYGSGSQAEV